MSPRTDDPRRRCPRCGEHQAAILKPPGALCPACVLETRGMWRAGEGKGNSYTGHVGHVKRPRR